MTKTFSLVMKAAELFPGNQAYQEKWIQNQQYLNERKINALNTGGWLVPGGKFMNDFKFSKFFNAASIEKYEKYFSKIRYVN